MAQRRFGPTLGAGVVIVEKEAEKLAEAAPLGVTLYVTPLDRGDTSKLISTFSKRDMLRKCGGLISGFDGPDCAQDFWDHGAGAGELHLIRVGKSSMRQAQIDVYSREMVDEPDDYAAGKARAVMRVFAKNGGRWGSRKRVYHREVALITDINPTTIETGITMLQDEWVGGVVRLDGVTTKSYLITANSTAGIITVESDADMEADLAAVPSTDKGYTLELTVRTDTFGVKRQVAVELGDGESNPSSEFSLNVWVDEVLVRRYPNLSMDPASPRYFEGLINDDQGNFEIEVEDLLTPSAPTPHDRRPANENGIVSAISATVLTSKLHQVRQTAGNANAAFALGTTTDAHKYRDIFEFEVTAITPGAPDTATISMKSMRVGGGEAVHASVTANNLDTTTFTFNAPTAPHVPPIVITCGSTVFEAGDKFQVDYFPFEPDALIGGFLCADLVNKPRARFKIVDNDHKTITVQSGDLTTDGGGAVNDRFMVFWQQPLGGPDRLSAVPTNGYDGLTGLGDTDWTAVHLNPGATYARQLFGQNKGLVKLATPDKTATAVVQAGVALAEAFNWQYRIEIPDTVETEDAAVSHINDTVGRNDFAVTSFPSYADVLDLEQPGRLKRIPMTGMIHGREALVAKNFDGYHKAAAGQDVTLPRVVKLPFSTVLNEEALNPQGVNVVKKLKGNFVLWGDRTVSLDPAWKFKHQRELMSHYECRLRESFDFIIFALNDTETQNLLISSLQAFFLPEFVKRAVRGKTFEEAVVIKIDGENNTDATRATGDLFADIALRLADTVERFNIRIGKQGIFDSVSA